MPVCLGLGNYCLLPDFESVKRTRDEIALISCVSPKDLTDKLFADKFRTGDVDTGADMSEYDYIDMQQDETVAIDNLDTTSNSQLARARLA